jgi:hypothetical protein
MGRADRPRFHRARTRSYMPGAPASRWPTRPDPPRGANPCPTRRRCGDAARRAQRRRARARPTRCSRANLRSTRRGLVSLRHAPLGGVPGRRIPRRLYREPPPNHDRTSGRDALSRGRPSLGAGPRMAIERRETPESWRSGGSPAGRNAGARAAHGPESLPTRKETHLAGSGPILFRQPPRTAFERWTAFRGTMPDATAAYGVEGRVSRRPTLRSRTT